MWFGRYVNDIDLFPAGIAERPVDGGLVGPTFACLLARQFQELRRGDRYWYENFAESTDTTAFTPGKILRYMIYIAACDQLTPSCLQHDFVN